jgi:hypothetical protein
LDERAEAFFESTEAWVKGADALFESSENLV